MRPATLTSLLSATLVVLLSGCTLSEPIALASGSSAELRSCRAIVASSDCFQDANAIARELRSYVPGIHPAQVEEACARVDLHFTECSLCLDCDPYEPHLPWRLDATVHVGVGTVLVWSSNQPSWCVREDCLFREFTRALGLFWSSAIRSNASGPAKSGQPNPSFQRTACGGR
jgi:hypothetical protein